MPNRSNIDRDPESIFRKYYSDHPFVDRFVGCSEGAVDVLVPVIHTNELWEANLLSFYREIPIHKLLIGDGGCIDNSLTIANRFPRVVVYDHQKYTSLGYSVRKLIEAVETDWFIYLHSDVYLPEGWFDSMKRYQSEYDWFGCRMQHTVMIEHQVDYGERPWAGSQMGRKRAFQEGLTRIDDDYVYRQEDYVFAGIVQKGGFKEGRVEDTFHYHQTMYKPTPWSRKVKSVKLDLELSRAEEVRTCMTMAKGIVKYLEPPRLSDAVTQNVDRLQELGELSWADFNRWVRETNPAWMPHLRRKRVMGRLRAFVRAASRLVR